MANYTHGMTVNRDGPGDLSDDDFRHLRKAADWDWALDLLRRMSRKGERPALQFAWWIAMKRPKKRDNRQTIAAPRPSVQAAQPAAGLVPPLVSPDPIARPATLTERSTNIAMSDLTSTSAVASDCCFLQSDIQCLLSRPLVEPIESRTPFPHTFLLKETDTYANVITKLDLAKSEFMPVGAWHLEDFTQGMSVNGHSPCGLYAPIEVRDFRDAADWDFALEELRKMRRQKIEHPVLSFTWWSRLKAPDERSTDFTVSKAINETAATGCFLPSADVRCLVRRPWLPSLEKHAPVQRNFLLKKTDTYAQVIAKLAIEKSFMMPEGAWHAEKYTQITSVLAISGQGLYQTKAVDFQEAKGCKIALDELRQLSRQKKLVNPQLVFEWNFVLKQPRAINASTATLPVQAPQPAAELASAQIFPSSIAIEESATLTERSVNIATLKAINTLQATKNLLPNLINCTAIRPCIKSIEESPPEPHHFYLKRSDTYEMVIAKLGLIKSAELLPDVVWQPEKYAQSMTVHVTTGQGQDRRAIPFRTSVDWKSALVEVMNVASQELQKPRLVFTWHLSLRDRDCDQRIAESPVERPQPANKLAGIAAAGRASKRTSEWVTNTRDEIHIQPQQSRRRIEEDAPVPPQPDMIEDFTKRQYCKTCVPTLPFMYCFYNPVNKTHMRVHLVNQQQVESERACHSSPAAPIDSPPGPKPCQELQSTSSAPSILDVSETEVVKPYSSPARLVHSSSDSAALKRKQSAAWERIKSQVNGAAEDHMLCDWIDTALLYDARTKEISVEQLAREFYDARILYSDIRKELDSGVEVHGSAGIWGRLKWPNGTFPEIIKDNMIKTHDTWFFHWLRRNESTELERDCWINKRHFGEADDDECSTCGGYYDMRC